MAVDPSAPCVSIIIPTLNSSETLERCLEAIRNQEFSDEDYEILVVDGGSIDSTRQIAKKYRVTNILENPRKTAEAAKAVGLKTAKGKYVAFIDSDNFIIGKDWLSRMIDPLDRDLQVVLSEPLYFHWEKTAPVITRYCALMGLNDPLCYYTGNFDRWNYAKQQWTGFSTVDHDCGDWFWFELGVKNLFPTLGANGTVYRREILTPFLESDFFFDVDIPVLLAQKAQSSIRMAKVKTAVLHWYCPHFSSFIRKQNRRIQDYLFHKNRGERVRVERSYPKTGMAWFILAVVLVLPCLWTSLTGYIRKKDSAWFYHWILCGLTLIVYVWGVIKRCTISTRQADRSEWQATPCG